MSLLLPLLGVGAAIGFGLRGTIDGEASSEEVASPDKITATLEERVIQQKTVVSASLNSSGFSVKAPTMEGVETVISGYPVEKGTDIEPGDVVAVVSDRPILSLQGILTPYRDMKPGNKGTDIQQLNAALFRLGLRADAGNDVFGDETKKGIERLYQNAGFDPPTTITDFAEAREVLLEQVESAKKGTVAAESSDTEAISEWEGAIESAKRDLEFKKQLLNSISSGESEIPSDGDEDQDSEQQPINPDFAKIKAENDVAEAKKLLTDLESRSPQSTRSDATEALQQAQSDLANFDAKEGIFLPRGEVIFLPEEKAKVSKLSSAVGQAVSPGQEIVQLDTGGLVWTGEIESRLADSLTPDSKVNALDPVSGKRFPMKFVDEENNASLGTTDVEPSAGEDEGTAEEDSTDSPNDVNSSSYSTLHFEAKASVLPEPVPLELVVEIVLRESVGVALAAPERAIKVVGPAKAELSVLDVQGNQKTIPVTPGLVGDGYIELLDPDSELAPGTRVLIRKARE